MVLELDERLALIIQELTLRKGTVALKVGAQRVVGRIE
jgi:hypothetical protein